MFEHHSNYRSHVLRRDELIREAQRRALVREAREARRRERREDRREARSGRSRFTPAA